MSTKQPRRGAAKQGADKQAVKAAPENTGARGGDENATENGGNVEQTAGTVTAGGGGGNAEKEKPAPREKLTAKNADYFQNKQGRVFKATDVLRRLAYRQKLIPLRASDIQE